MAVNQRDLRVDGRPENRIGEYFDQEPPLRDLFGQLSEDGTRLIKQEIALAKVEMRTMVSALVRDAVKVGIAVAFGMLGALAGLAFMIIGLGALIDSYWLSALIVSAVFLVIGAVLARQASSDLEHRDLKPTRTIDTLNEDADWAKREAAEVKQEWKSGTTDGGMVV